MSQKQPKLKVIIHVFGLFGGRTSIATRCLQGPWEVIGKESCGLERIYWCIYVHFEAILCFTRNEQMRCSESFRGNLNGAKHPRNIISHVSFPRSFLGENMTRPGEVKKISQKQPKLKVIIHTFGLSRGSSFKCHGMSPKAIGGCWKRGMWLGTNIWMPLHSFRDNFMFHVKWKNETFIVFSRQHKWCQAPVQRNKSRRLSYELFGRKYDETWKSKKKSQKHPKLKVIIHAFGLSRRPISERHGLLPGAIRGHGKGVMWLGTNIWMPLRSFRVNFMFQEKWTNGVFKGFSRQLKWCQAFVNRYKSRRLSLELFGKKYDQLRRSPKISQNNQNEGYNTRFRPFSGADATGCLLGPWEVIGKE